MNERDFIYWLQGYLELSETKELNERQLEIVKEHMALVMTKVTPYVPYTPSTEPGNPLWTTSPIMC